MSLRSTLGLVALVLPASALAAGGSGTPSDPYLIETCGEFDGMRNDLAAHYRLIVEPDCAGYGSIAPIGNDTTPFTGELDGNDNAIYNLDVVSSDDTVGIFGTTNGAYIHDFYTESSSVTAATNGHAGGIIGRAINTTVYQVQTDSVVTSTSGIAGGIVGVADASTFVNVGSNGSVAGDQAGGFIGRFTYEGDGTGYAGPDFYRCYSTSSVTAPTRGGGFAAYIEDAAIVETYAIGDVGNGGGTLALGGGWAAETRRVSLRDSYSWGTVSSDTAGALIGGPIGDITLTNVYALGSASTDPQGFFAYLDFESETGTLTEVDSVYISHADQQSGAADIYYSASTPPLDQWDFVNIWVETNFGGIVIFPRLQMAQATEPGAPGGGGGGLVCDVGSPYDWDDDGLDDGCRGTNVLIDPTVTIPPGTRLGNNVTIEAYVQVGNGLVVGSGSYIAERATLGGGNVLGDNVIIGRRAIISDDNVFGSDTTIGRAAQIDDDGRFGAFSNIGYGAIVGSGVQVDGALILGSLAELGYLNGSGDIQVSGSITIARGARVATDFPAELTAGDGVIIGPNTVVGTGSTLGDNVRLRKEAQVGQNASLGSGARIGRGAIIGDDVSVAGSANISANVQLCDTTSLFSGTLSRTFVDPACSVSN